MVSNKALAAVLCGSVFVASSIQDASSAQNVVEHTAAKTNAVFDSEWLEHFKFMISIERFYAMHSDTDAARRKEWLAALDNLEMTDEQLRKTGKGSAEFEQAKDRLQKARQNAGKSYEDVLEFAYARASTR